MKKYLTAALLLFYTSPSKAFTVNVFYDDALNKTAEAFVKQAEWDKKVGNYLGKLERRYVPEYVSKYGGWALTIHRVIEKQYISHKWTF